MQVECPGLVATGVNGEAICLDQMGQPMEWEVAPAFQIDFEAVVEPFSVGFLLMASCWALGKAVALVVSLVRR